MNEQDLEGSLVLEKLAEIGKLDEFYAAVDADDFMRAKSLMRQASIDAQTIDAVIRQMAQ